MNLLIEYYKYVCRMKYNHSQQYIAHINIGVDRPYWPEHHLVAELRNQ